MYRTNNTQSNRTQCTLGYRTLHTQKKLQNSTHTHKATELNTQAKQQNSTHTQSNTTQHTHTHKTTELNTHKTTLYRTQHTVTVTKLYEHKVAGFTTISHTNVTLCQSIRLHITIIVFSCPNKSALRFHGIGHLENWQCKKRDQSETQKLVTRNESLARETNCDFSKYM